MSEMINRLDFVYPLPIKRAVSGFSLLELVLVLFLMGTVMLTSLFLVDGADDQARYEETKNKLAMIKHAIVGDANRTLNGEPEITGFVADMGRLPVCIRELVDGKCVDSDPAPPLWVLNNASGLWAGWRGPYLNTSVGNDFRDGWGNKNTDAVEDDSNFGWDFDDTSVSGELTIKSLGKDGALGATIEDYTADLDIRINKHDYVLNLVSWDTLYLRFNKVTDAIKTIAKESLRLKLNAINDGVVNTMAVTTPTADPVVDNASRDLQDFLSLEFPEDNLILMPSTGVIPVEPGTVTLPPGSSLTGTTLTVTEGMLTFNTGVVDEVPCNVAGQTCILPVKSGEIIVPATSTISGNTLTLVAGSMQLPLSLVAPIDVGLNSSDLLLNVGVHSLTVVCNDVGNVNDAKRYDGTCSTTPNNEPHYFKLAPRHAAPLKPNPFIWTIE